MNSIVILESQFRELQQELYDGDGLERAAFLYCGRSLTEPRTSLVVKRLVRIDRRYMQSTRRSVSIASRAYVPAIARADANNECLVLVHSHPGGYSEFSDADDLSDAELFRVANHRAPNGPHASMILVGQDQPTLIARQVAANGEFHRVDSIAIVGDRLRLMGPRFESNGFAPEKWATRQVAAFGPDIQLLLQKLVVGVVGAGGTGSAVIEQLLRLGVGTTIVVDREELTSSNVTRVHHSSRNENVGLSKAHIAREHANFIGLGSIVQPVTGDLLEEDVTKKLRECDLVFGCTDDHAGRAILCKLSSYYNLPVLDMAIAIDSEDGVIRDILGRITYLRPGAACLMCRGRINQRWIDAESLRRIAPDEYQRRREENYVPELDLQDPAVVMFTTHVASRAVAWFLHLLTGYLGDEFRSTEIMERLHLMEINTNRRQGKPDHHCMDANRWGTGDKTNFLDTIW